MAKKVGYIPPEVAEVPTRFNEQNIESLKDDAHKNILRVGGGLEDKLMKSVEELNRIKMEKVLAEEKEKERQARKQKIEKVTSKLNQEKSDALLCQQREHDVQIEAIKMQIKELERVRFNKLIAEEREHTVQQLYYQEKRLRAEFEEMLRKAKAEAAEEERRKMELSMGNGQKMMEQEMANQKAQLLADFNKQLAENEAMVAVRIQRALDECEARWKRACEKTIAELEDGYLKEQARLEQRIKDLEDQLLAMTNTLKLMDQRVEIRDKKIEKLRESFQNFIQEIGGYNEEQSRMMIPNLDLIEFGEDDNGSVVATARCKQSQSNIELI